MDSSVKAAPKRKRYEPKEKELTIRLGGKIASSLSLIPVNQHHEKKEASRAARRAKVFETQKTVKRLKDLRKKNESLEGTSSLEEELQLIKSTDHNGIGTTALRSKILKDHALRSNADVLASVAQELGEAISPPQSGSAAAKVYSRLLSSKILAKQVADSVLSLKTLLDPSLRVKDGSSMDEPLVAEGTITEEFADEATDARPTKKTRPSEIFDNGDEDHDDGWESGTVNDGYDEELVAQGDGWESGSIQGGGSEDSDSDSDASSDSEVDMQPTKSGNKAKTRTQPTKHGDSSTFLPSLSVGFIRGGSSDSDFDNMGGGDAGDMPKKNRRGQRARRAIWEKKFGRNANHKKKEAAEEQEQAVQNAYAQRKGSRPQPTMRTKGAQGPGLRQGSHTGTAIQHRSNQESSEARQQPNHHQSEQLVAHTHAQKSIHDLRRSKDKALDVKPLHPSWEAKRKMKEKESGSLVPSQGKKIIF